MEIKVTQTPEFTITINGTRLAGMRKTGEWEGMAKFEGGQGVVILMDQRSPVVRAFDSALTWSAGDNWVLVKASPDILALLQQQKAAP